MKNFLLNYPEFANWIIGILLSVISVLGTMILGYLIGVYKKTGALNGKIEKNHSTLLSFKGKFHENLSKILTSQVTLGQGFTDLQRTLGNATLAINDARAEINKIMEKLDRSDNKLEETTRALEKSLQLLKTHNTQIIKLKNDLLLIKGSKNET